MSPEDASNSIHDVDLKINSMNKDIEQIDRLCYKLTESIEKLQEVNISLTKMITLHEEKLEQRLRNDDIIRNDLRDINTRITLECKERDTKIEQLERQLLEKIESVPCNDVRSLKKNSSDESILNKFRWMIIGGALTLGWLIGNINLAELATLIK